MGSSLCKQKYNRNELLALLRDSNTYGITLLTYTEFINSPIYIKNINPTEDLTTNDEFYINIWNKWKETHPSLKDLPDISTNIIILIIKSPIVHLKYKIPKFHALWQRNALKRFYQLQDWNVEIESFHGTNQFTLLQNIDNYIHYILDHYTYSDIVQHINEVYTPTLWHISQMTDSTWRNIIIKLNNSPHSDSNKLNIIQTICHDKTISLFTELDAKIII